MSAFFTALGALFTPVVVFFVSVVAIISLLLWCISDPEGAVNLFICKIIDIIATPFPSTPDNLKIGALLTSASEGLPAIGRGVLAEVFATVSSIFLISLVIRIYKLIPFKST